MSSQAMIEAWKNAGSFLSYRGNKIFYIDKEPLKENVILILHGYPTCSFDYKEILGPISKEYRVVIPDFLGFGLSDKPANGKYLMVEQADMVEALCSHLGITNFNLVAHNYGTTVATELIHRSNNQYLGFSLKSITLCNGSMLIDMSQLRPIQKMLKSTITGPIIARLSNKNTFHRNMKNIWLDKQKYDINEMQPLWDLLVSNGGKKVLPIITRYINQRFQYYERWIGALQKTEVPVHILWAENDPVAVIEMAHKLESLIPRNDKTIIPDCGHYPMIEKGEQWTKLVLDWINHQRNMFSN